MRSDNFEFHFSYFLQLKIKYAKYFLSCVFWIVTNWRNNKQIFTSWEFTFQQFKQIWIAFSFFSNKTFLRIILSSNSTIRYGMLLCNYGFLIELQVLITLLITCFYHLSHIVINNLVKSWFESLSIWLYTSMALW